MEKQYYYVDIDLDTKKIIKHGIISQATHAGNTEIVGVHRVFLTKGQFHKLEKKINL